MQDENLVDFYQWLQDDVFAATSTLPRAKIYDVVFSMAYYSCVGPYAGYYDASFDGYVCPSDLDVPDPYICWEDWTETDEEGCLEWEYCNWDPEIKNATECEALLDVLDGFCYSSETEEVISIPAVCYYVNEDVDDFDCEYLGGEWDLFYDACYDPDLTEDECILEDLLVVGDDSYTAALQYLSYCIISEDEAEDACDYEFVPTVGWCIDFDTTMYVCENASNTWWVGRAWGDEFATEDDCYAGICSDMITTDPTECATLSECDLDCTACSGPAYCYSDASELTCGLLGGEYEAECILPALNEAECDYYNGTWFDCSSFSDMDGNSVFWKKIIL